MRVIAGTAGGIQLDVPRSGVRPTMDRVKAAIFSSLAEEVVDARVLDLFAGSGALGLEALSRGAGSAFFVDDDRRAIAAIEHNLTKLKMRAATRQQDVFEFLERWKAPARFHIVFADPPYDRMKSGESYTEKLLGSDGLRALLEPHGIFVLEKRPSETLPDLPQWQTIRRKAYGATEVIFFRLNLESPA